MTDARTLNTQRHDEKIARIRSNPDLSEHAKRRMIGEIHQEAVAEHARLVQEAREAREEAVRSAERKVLGISYPERASAYEKALIALSYRDARDRAERAAADTDNPDALAEIMERAETSGDAQLAEAAYHVATLRGARAITDAYLADRPAARRRWEAYVEARQEDDPLRVNALAGALAGGVGPQRPSELG